MISIFLCVWSALSMVLAHYIPTATVTGTSEIAFVLLLFPHPEASSAILCLGAILFLGAQERMDILLAWLWGFGCLTLAHVATLGGLGSQVVLYARLGVFAKGHTPKTFWILLGRAIITVGE